MGRNRILRDDGLLRNLDARAFGVPDWLLLQVVSLIQGAVERAGFHSIRQLMGKPPETIHFSLRGRSPATWGFATGAQTTRADSLTIAAGG